MANAKQKPQWGTQKLNTCYVNKTRNRMSFSNWASFKKIMSFKEVTNYLMLLCVWDLSFMKAPEWGEAQLWGLSLASASG